ncbi:MAG: hypothetical protein LBH00_00595 [Planctomycetaceae bacterium]|jgi:tetratricopeptide (TPR) repeat protein|nr:hypothetical protein [Planctomycetaceae bacterium]
MLKRLLYLLFLPVFFGCSSSSKEFAAFHDAQSAFESGAFLQAADLYQDLAGQGFKSGAVYYNLGNTWAKAGEPGKAAAAYLLAKRYIPNDPQLNANLQEVLKENGGLPAVSEKPLFEHIFFWQNSIGIQTKIAVSLFFSVLTFFGGVLALFWKKQRLKQIVFYAVLLTLLTVCSAGYDWYRYDFLRNVIVVEKNAMPRKGNSEQYEPVFVSPILFGTTATVLDERSEWYFLRFPGGLEGWLPKIQTQRLE